MRNGSEHSCAIAGVVVAGACSTVVHTHRQCFSIAQYLVRATAIDGGDEADAARLLLVLRVVQALRAGSLPRLATRAHTDASLQQLTYRLVP